MSHDEENSSNGAFVTGFTVGLFAGAAGYFLFGTKQGSEMRKRMVEDWDNAKYRLAEEGIIEDPNESLGDFLRDLAHTAFSHPESVARNIGQEIVAEGKKLAKTSTVTPRKKDNSKRFKGT